MNKRIFSVAFFLLVSLSISAQKQVTTVDENVADFYLSFTNPEFYVTADSSLRQKNLSKYYSLYSYLYAEALAKGEDKKQAATLDSLALYIKKRYLAEKLIKEMTESISINKDESLAFYNTHSTDYSQPAVCSYFQVFILKEEAETIEKAKKKVLELSALPDLEGMFKGDKNEAFGISYERDIKLMPGYAITPYVEHLKLKQFSEPLQVPGFNSKMIYYVVSRANKTMKPFEEVDEECRNRARAEKSQKMLDELYLQALKRFPVPELK